MRATKIKRFNSRLYFYYVNNGINPLTIAVNLSQVPSIIIKEQSYIKLPKELQDKTKQIEGCKRDILSKSRQSITSYTALLGG